MKKETPQNIVYNHVRGQILSRALFPGNRIVEEEIVQATGVSRTSIRPALLHLAYEGLVELIPNRGAFVARPTREDMLRVYRVRRVLECGALEEALAARTDGQLAAMAANLTEQEALTEHYTRQEYVALNHRFHWMLVEMAGNPYYEKYLKEIYNRINTFLLFYDNAVDNKSLESHRMIYEALRDRDTEKGLQGIRLDVDLALEDLHTDVDF